jgi:hypothetical protein
VELLPAALETGADEAGPVFGRGIDSADVGNSSTVSGLISTGATIKRPRPFATRVVAAKMKTANMDL